MALGSELLTSVVLLLLVIIAQLALALCCHPSCSLLYLVGICFARARACTRAISLILVKALDVGG